MQAIRLADDVHRNPSQWIETTETLSREGKGGGKGAPCVLLPSASCNSVDRRSLLLPSMSWCNRMILDTECPDSAACHNQELGFVMSSSFPANSHSQYALMCGIQHRLASSVRQRSELSGGKHMMPSRGPQFVFVEQTGTLVPYYHQGGRWGS